MTPMVRPMMWLRPAKAGKALWPTSRQLYGRNCLNLLGSPLATSAARASGAVSDLLLKVTPPRAPRDLVLRSRLQSDGAQFRDRPAIVVQAPAGFGKTSLLAQWRREHLAHGTVVAWLSAQEEDDLQRFVQSLALAVRVGSGRPTFGHTLLEGAAPGSLEGITMWLAEVAQSALDVVLIVDRAECLPAAAREGLIYLLHNAPPNLCVEVAARIECDLGVSELITYGHCALVGTGALRFQLEETIALVRSRFGTRIDTDTSARLHELTEGWPLGLQLALADIARTANPRAGHRCDVGPLRRSARPLRPYVGVESRCRRRSISDTHRACRPSASRLVPCVD
jgi:LuxR family maltose regulon positive regulatory protein